ncbi:MAG TPA: CDP-alcohol phosphatidyltransferase family protein [Candidatus Dormibacteraeota bacterium]|nr:CDP-alcohol phosphatidyltransferase family protein [Candidatus Dormibacteraeota bacterium]
MARTSLTRKRLVGLDRSGPPPPETQRGAPLNPWTIPNAIGYIRLALIPVFLIVALSSDDGNSTTALVIYIVIAATDYLDGITARITGQYSRLGALLDPLVDRLLVISAVVVNYRFDLLPRWALIVLAARELLMLVLTRIGMKRGLDLKINMVGRWAVWPVMVSLGLALVDDSWVPEALLYVGLAMTLWATALYFRDAREAMQQNTQA